MKTYFKDVQTLEELRKQYKVLLKKYHPDNGNGSEEITKAINMKYDFAEDSLLREMLQKVIYFSDITSEIIGNWIYPQLLRQYSIRR